jgi:hypothetical protein
LQGSNPPCGLHLVLLLLLLLVILLLLLLLPVSQRLLPDPWLREMWQQRQRLYAAC